MPLRSSTRLVRNTWYFEYFKFCIQLIHKVTEKKPFFYNYIMYLVCSFANTNHNYKYFCSCCLSSNAKYFLKYWLKNHDDFVHKFTWKKNDWYQKRFDKQLINKYTTTYTHFSSSCLKIHFIGVFLIMWLKLYFHVINTC